MLKGLLRLGGVDAAGKGIPSTQGVGSLLGIPLLSLLPCACVSKPFLGVSVASGILLACRRLCCRHSLVFMHAATLVCVAEASATGLDLQHTCVFVL